MTIEVITKDELQVLKQEIIQEVGNIIRAAHDKPKQLLKSADVRKLLGISATTLQTLRINGTLSSSKVGGSLYYLYDDVMKVVNDNKCEGQAKAKKSKKGLHTEKEVQNEK